MKSSAPRSSPVPLAIEYVRIGTLAPDPLNPRQHSKTQLKQIRRSIKAFGFVMPILVDRFGRIVAGVGRYLAAQEMGMSMIPVIRLEALTEAQVKAYRVADNRLAEFSTWDDQLLGKVFGELAELKLDFRIEDTGFSITEIDGFITQLSGPTGNSPDPADEFPAPSDQLPIIRPGGLWAVPKHR